MAKVAVAVPATLLNAVLVPRVAAPSLKVSVPVACVAPKLGVTVTVNVTTWPKVDGLGGLAEVIVVVLVAGLMVMANEAVSSVPILLVARTTIPENVPPIVGVPVKAPAALTFKPGGNEPDCKV